MNINVVYFSETGNTPKAARAMEGVFRSDNHSVRTVSYKKLGRSGPVDPEVVGMGQTYRVERLW